MIEILLKEYVEAFNTNPNSKKVWEKYYDLRVYIFSQFYFEDAEYIVNVFNPDHYKTKIIYTKVLKKIKSAINNIN